MKKKGGMLLLFLLSVFMLAGWGKKEVRLLNSNKLIDLNKAIELAKPGGSAGDAEEPSDKEASDAADESEDVNDKTGEETAASKRDIVIRVRGEDIYYACGTDDPEVISAAQLENRIRLDHSAGSRLTLYDDFAEAHVYKDVRKVLADLKSSIGLNYEEEQLSETSPDSPDGRSGTPDSHRS